MYLHKIFINKKRNDVLFIYKTKNTVRPYRIYTVEEKHFFYLGSIDALNNDILIPATILTTFYNKEKTFKIRLFRFRNKNYIQKLDCLTNYIETISLSLKQYSYMYYQLNKKKHYQNCKISNKWDTLCTLGYLKEF